MKLAEMGSWIGDAKNGLWVREVRKLTENGHQTSLISTVYSQFSLRDAAGMFSRWSQENLFRYMMEHFAIDLLSEYRTEAIPGTSRPVVSPPWRELEGRFLLKDCGQLTADFRGLSTLVRHSAQATRSLRIPADAGRRFQSKR